MNQTSIKTILILCISMTSYLASFSQDIFWTGTGSNGSWTNPDNWNPVRVPNSDDIVEIGNSGTVSVTQSGIEIKGLILRANGSLILNNADARIDINNSPQEGIKFILRGKLTINSGTISISNSAGDGIFADGQATIINHGSLFINTFGEDGIHINNNSTITNTGVITIDQLGSIAPVLGINAEDGALTNQSGGQIFITTCQSPFPTIATLHIDDGFEYEDSGETLIFKRNCN